MFWTCIRTSLFSNRHHLLRRVHPCRHPDLSFLLFLLFLLYGGSSWTCSTSGTSWGGGDNVGKKFIDFGTLEGLGEKEWPVWLNFVSGLLDDGGQFCGVNWESI